MVFNIHTDGNWALRFVGYGRAVARTPIRFSRIGGADDVLGRKEKMVPFRLRLSSGVDIFSLRRGFGATIADC